MYKLQVAAASCSENSDGDASVTPSLDEASAKPISMRLGAWPRAWRPAAETRRKLAHSKAHSRLGGGCGPQGMAPSQSEGRAGAQLVHQPADRNRTLHDVIDGYRAEQFLLSDPVQAGADGAAALRAIGIAAEEAGLDPGLEIGGIVHRHFGKHAL